jgi:Bifunctional DNA primase/polymerase, N-terminal
MKPGMTTLEWAVAYAAHGLDVFPCAANKVPLTPNGFLDATRDPGTIQVWWARWQCAEPALAVPGRIVVVDIDRKNRKDGFRDFERLDGRDPLSVETPIATTPSGGLHLYFMASKPYRNAVAIDGTGIDTRTTGGYVILPTGGNGRRWLRRLSTTPMRLSPGWLDCVARQEPPAGLSARPSPLEAGPAGPLSTIARELLQKAIARILNAPQGEQEDTRHRQCFWVGCLIADGVLDYAIASRALVTAAKLMADHAEPWRNLEEKVQASIERGMEKGGHP